MPVQVQSTGRINTSQVDLISLNVIPQNMTNAPSTKNFISNCQKLSTK